MTSAREFRILLALEFCKCSDVKRTTAENIQNAVSMEFCECSDVKRTAAKNIVRYYQHEKLMNAVMLSRLLQRIFKILIE